MIEKIHPGKQIEDSYDAIVVGSGISGGWAAKELTELGLDTLVLERGRHVVHGDDYVTEHEPAWDMRFRGLGDRLEWRKERFNQTKSGVVNEGNSHFFVNDRENPYSWHDGMTYLWIRGYHTGGRSIMWGRQTYRWSDLDFTANLREEIGVDWPIRYEDIAPWYDHVEEFAGITGSAEGIPTLPDGVFLPPMEMTCVEKHARREIEAAFPGRHLIIGRAAVLTRPHKGREACHYCGPCDRGCTAGAYFSSLSSTLPAAAATGRLTLRPDSIVHSLVYDASRGRVSGVRLIDRLTRKEHEIAAKVVFLCASSMGSTQVLLNSTSPSFPQGLGNSGGVLGHYAMDHHFKVGASAEFPGFEDRYYYGNRPNGIYIPRFRNLDEQTKQAGFLRGYGYEGWSGRAAWWRGIGLPGFGKDLKAQLRDPGPWTMGLDGFGETLPDFDNYVELDRDKVDEWGLPTLKFHCSLRENELKMREDMATQAAEMLEAAGGRNVTPYVNEYRPGEGIHEMGTARMGRDPATSVLNGHNQLHDAPNVFVTDGACMTSSACQNPSLTYMALTARAAHFAAAELTKGNL
jgi:choline dehydrogenase-like flavoprotein